MNYKFIDLSKQIEKRLIKQNHEISEEKIQIKKTAAVCKTSVSMKQKLRIIFKR